MFGATGLYGWQGGGAAKQMTKKQRHERPKKRQPRLQRLLVGRSRRCKTQSRCTEDCRLNCEGRQLAGNVFPAHFIFPNTEIYLDFFCVLTFAHLAFWAAAIFFREAADTARFLGALTALCSCPPLPFALAQRAF